MTATSDQIEQLRRMTAEPTQDTYSDSDMATYLERYPLLDEQGKRPYTLSSNSPPERETNDAWIPTYDIYAAAGDIWEEKAAAVASLYDFKADGGDYARSQRYEQYMKMARSNRSRRSSKTMTLVKWPEEDNNGSTIPWIGNLPEVD